LVAVALTVPVTAVSALTAVGWLAWPGGAAGCELLADPWMAWADPWMAWAVPWTMPVTAAMADDAWPVLAVGAAVLDVALAVGAGVLAAEDAWAEVPLPAAELLVPLVTAWLAGGGWVAGCDPLADT
jgi:hypothetical protein